MPNSDYVEKLENAIKKGIVETPKPIRRLFRWNHCPLCDGKLSRKCFPQGIGILNCMAGVGCLTDIYYYECSGNCKYEYARYE